MNPEDTKDKRDANSGVPPRPGSIPPQAALPEDLLDAPMPGNTQPPAPAPAGFESPPARIGPQDTDVEAPPADASDDASAADDAPEPVAAVPAPVPVAQEHLPVSPLVDGEAPTLAPQADRPAAKDAEERSAQAAANTVPPEATRPEPADEDDDAPLAAAPIGGADDLDYQPSAELPIPLILGGVAVLIVLLFGG